MEKELNSKCESCGYTLSFDPISQALKCPQCGSVKSIVSKDLPDKKEYNPQSKVEKNEQLSVRFECENCGAKTSASDRVNGVCPYCGSTNVKQLDNSIEFKPDAILPFKISKDEAIEKYRSWLKSKKFVPSKLKSSTRLNKIEGIYFPCWDYDFNVNSKIDGVGINIHTRTVTSTINGQQVTRTETYTTRHPFSGTRFDVFTDYLNEASPYLTSSEMRDLGRWTLEGLKVYSPEYLLGFMSSGFDTQLHDSFDMVTRQAKSEITDRAKMQFRYDNYEYINVKSTFNSIMWRYIYLPLWISSYAFNKKTYRFLVNGSTGKVSGKVPRSGWKIFGLVMGILAGVGILAGGIMYLKSKYNF